MPKAMTAAVTSMSSSAEAIANAVCVCVQKSVAAKVVPVCCHTLQPHHGAKGNAGGCDVTVLFGRSFCNKVFADGASTVFGALSPCDGATGNEGACDANVFIRQRCCNTVCEQKDGGSYDPASVC